MVAEFGLKAVPVGKVKQGNARTVPGTASSDAQAFCLLTVSVIVRIRALSAEGAADRLGPLDHVPRHMIEAITIGSVGQSRIVDADNSRLCAWIFLPIVEPDFIIADSRSQRIIKVIRPPCRGSTLTVLCGVRSTPSSGLRKDRSACCPMAKITEKSALRELQKLIRWVSRLAPISRSWLAFPGVSLGL